MTSSYCSVQFFSVFHWLLSIDKSHISSRQRNHTVFNWSPSIGKTRMIPGFMGTICIVHLPERTETVHGPNYRIRLAAIAGFNMIVCRSYASAKRGTTIRATW